MSIIDRNVRATELISLANKMANTTTQGAWGSYDKTALCTIAHISDLHNDATRYQNFLQYVKAVTEIDHVFETGDLVDTPIAGQYTAMYAKETAENFSPYKVVGNHEKYAGGEYMADADIYTSLHMDTSTGKLYYYVDDITYNIRFIVLDQYEIDESKYKLEHISQTQIDWFISALQGAITAGYDVIVAMHACESGGSFPDKKSTASSASVYDANGNALAGASFYQRFAQWKGMTDLQNVCSGTPIEDIVNAFKNGTSVSKTYTFSDTSSSISVSASFATAGTFIAYMVGHVHGDFIGCSSVHPDQTYLAVCSGNPAYGNVGDLQRKAGEFSEDAFNVYVIDQTHRLIKVIRVGANVNDILEERIMALYAY